MEAPLFEIDRGKTCARVNRPSMKLPGPAGQELAKSGWGEGCPTTLRDTCQNLKRGWVVGDPWPRRAVEGGGREGTLVARMGCTGAHSLAALSYG